MDGGNQIEQVGRLIHQLHFTFDQAEWVNDLGWPLADGRRAILSGDELDQAYARSIEIRVAEGSKPPGHSGKVRTVPLAPERRSNEH
jgi:hypothetical protein